MPRGFQSHAAGPMRTGGVFAPPVNADADAALRARAATTNPDRFTPEHAAAYYAFAQVTDRKDALALHQACVSWDDVNEYGQAGLSFTDYRTMVDLRRQGVTPAVLRTWKAVHDNLPYKAIGTFTGAGLTPTEAAPYFTSTDQQRAPIAPADLDRIPDLVRQGISANRAHHYRTAGIARADHMLLLDRLGCRPRVVYAHRRALTSTPPPTVFEPSFVRYYRTVTRIVGDTNLDLVHALVAVNAEPAIAQEWKDTGAPTDRVGLLLLAGISPEEYTANPDLADQPETLAAMAALRGHTVDTPLVSADSLTLAV